MLCLCRCHKGVRTGVVAYHLRRCMHGLRCICVRRSRRVTEKLVVAKLGNPMFEEDLVMVKKEVCGGLARLCVASSCS